MPLDDEQRLSGHDAGRTGRRPGRSGIVILTDDQKEQAKALGLTFTELSVALRTHVAPETYAARKQEMQAERDAWDAKMADMGDAMLERARHWPTGRGQRPVLEEPPPEEGG